MLISVSDNVKPSCVTQRRKKANGLMTIFIVTLPTKGLRFFTVYEPLGRPDLALFKLIKTILEGNPIKVCDLDNHKRDFTYIDGIVSSVIVSLNNTTSIYKPQRR